MAGSCCNFTFDILRCCQLLYTETALFALPLTIWDCPPTCPHDTSVSSLSHTWSGTPLQSLFAFSNSFSCCSWLFFFSFEEYISERFVHLNTVFCWWIANVLCMIWIPRPQQMSDWKIFFFPSMSCLFTFLAISLDAWKLWLSVRVPCPWLFYVAATLSVSDLCLSQVTNTLFSSKSFIVWTLTLKSLFLSVFIQYEVRVQILSFSCQDLIAPPSVCLVNSIHCMHLSCFFLFYYFRCLYEFVALLTK